MSCLAVVARSVAATSSVSAGNASLEELAAIFVTRHDQLPFRNNIVMNQLYPTSQMLATCISFGAAPNKAIVGANAFAHAAGIHQHGVIANPCSLATRANVFSRRSTDCFIGLHLASIQ